MAPSQQYHTFKDPAFSAFPKCMYTLLCPVYIDVLFVRPLCVQAAGQAISAAQSLASGVANTSSSPASEKWIPDSLKMQTGLYSIHTCWVYWQKQRVFRGLRGMYTRAYTHTLCTHVHTHTHMSPTNMSAKNVLIIHGTMYSPTYVPIKSKELIGTNVCIRMYSYIYICTCIYCVHTHTHTRQIRIYLHIYKITCAKLHVRASVRQFCESREEHWNTHTNTRRHTHTDRHIHTYTYSKNLELHVPVFLRQSVSHGRRHTSTRVRSRTYARTDTHTHMYIFICIDVYI